MNLAPFAYMIIIIAGLKMANNIVVILLMAFFVFLIFLPLVKKLRSFGLSDFFTTIIVSFVLFGVLFIIGGFLVNSAQSFTQNLPLYQQKYDVLIPQAVTYLKQFGIELQSDSLVSMFNPISLIQHALGFIKSMGNIMTNGVLMLIIIIFLFLESSLMIEKIFYFLNSKEAKEHMLLFTQSINTYFAIKTFTSLLTGFLIYLMLSLAVPLTITLKMASSYTQKYRWISVLLSDKVR